MSDLKNENAQSTIIFLNTAWGIMETQSEKVDSEIKTNPKMLTELGNSINNLQKNNIKNISSSIKFDL